MPALTIFVGSLPVSASNARLEEIFSEIGPVKQCFVVREKGTDKCRGFGYVTFAMEEDAQRALKEIKQYDEKKLSLSVAKRKIIEKRKTGPKEPKESDAPAEPAAPAPQKAYEQKPKGIKKNDLKSRLIIRNLSFKCSEDDLKLEFAKFGTVLEAKIPLKPDGKMRGFAFVHFKTMAGADKALNAMNMKEIKGRQVAIDWAVPKDKYIATQPSTSAGNTTLVAAPAKPSSSVQLEDDEDKTQVKPEKKKVTPKPAVKQVEESDDEDDSEEQDEEEEEEEGEGEEDNDVSMEEKEGEDDDEDDDDDDDDEDDGDKSSLDSNDESQDEEEDEDDEEQAEKRKAARKLLPSDVKEGKTVFIRNLSFDTEEEGLEEALLQYGELNYIKVVVHPDTGHSKGVAFAQFKNKQAADKCIAAAEEEEESGGVRVDGRKLLIVAAVTRENAAQLKDSKVKVETGTRNLYLGREGLIRAGTKAAEGVPEADMLKRTRFEEIKRTKLRAINVFVSKTRLCIHNLPKSVDDRKLRGLCLQGVKGTKGVWIPECRVMYDKKPQKGQVMGQSLGYGFVQFQEHEHALSTLRYLNNNPDIFGPNKRPIVEFSLEDTRKLKIKEDRHQKNMEIARNRYFKEGVKPQSQAGNDVTGPRKGGYKAQASLEQTLSSQGQGNGPPQLQNQRGRYAGFQTKPEVEHVDLQNGKKRKAVLNFPSHRGPKIRLRDKGKQQAPTPKKSKPGSNRKEHERRQMEKPTHPRNQTFNTAGRQLSGPAKKQFKRRDGDRFDSLVAQYKKKLLGNADGNTGIKRSKWFDS